jgi:hypothetical protein
MPQRDWKRAAASCFTARTRLECRTLWTARNFRSLKDGLGSLLCVSADVILNRPVEVKVDHLSEDGGFEAAIDADSGASRGDTGIEASGDGYSRDSARARTISGNGAAVSAGSEGDPLRAA